MSRLREAAHHGKGCKSGTDQGVQERWGIEAYNLASEQQRR